MMAENLDDGEFWLPPQFLTDDDLLMDFNQINHKANNNGGHEVRYGFGLDGTHSDLSSPVESVVGSTETESDEDEFLSGLNRKLTLSDDLWKVDYGLGCENTMSWRMATSPKSTLCNVMGQGSSRGSPNCRSPPLSTPAQSKNEKVGWDLLQAAAGEVAKIRMGEKEFGTGFYPSRGHLVSQKPSQISVPDPEFRSNQSSYHHTQANEKSTVGWGNHKGFVPMVHTHNRGRPLGLSPSAWPTLQQSQQQQQPGSGMRAVFLGNPGAKRQCSGTGVFLPRRVGSPTETRKSAKPVCSTVLLPDRVVQALNLNLEVMDAGLPQLQARSNSNNVGFSTDYDAALKYRSNVPWEQARQRRNRAQPMNNEVQLPQEWTY